MFRFKSVPVSAKPTESWLRKQFQLQQRALQQRALLQLLNEKVGIGSEGDEQERQERLALEKCLEMRRYQEERQRLSSLLLNKIQPLLRYYPHDDCTTDTRRWIQVSRQELLEALELFAQLNGHSREAHQPQVAPLFGFSRSCFVDFLIYALSQRPAWVVTRELDRSHFGKNLIRNLLHTASTYTLGSGYQTEPEVKVCYIELFKLACKNASEPDVEHQAQRSEACFNP